MGGGFPKRVQWSLSHCYWRHQYLNTDTAGQHQGTRVRSNSTISTFSVYKLVEQTANGPCGDWSPLQSLLLQSLLTCWTYVVIDQAPVSAGHICAPTSVALIWPTVTDDHAPGGRFQWWMNECAPRVAFFPVVKQAAQGVIIKLQHLYILSSAWEHTALIK